MDQDITARLAGLELRLARVRWIALLAFGVAAGAMGWGLLARADRITEGQMWIAKDAGGVVRAMFGVSADGVGLTMYDSTGQMRLDVGIAPGGSPGILLLSKHGEPVATLNVTDGTVPTLRLTSVADSVRVEVAPRTGDPVRVRPRERPDTMTARQPHQ